jgi:crossover junction endodeoxyribonuclease RuvC
VGKNTLASLPPRVLSAAGVAAPSRRRMPRAIVPGGRGAPGGIVLGIDPGTLVVGFAAIEVGVGGPRFLEAGVIRTDRRSAAPERLGEILRLITALIARIRPTAVVVERAFAARNVQSALRIGEGRGVILACAASFGAHVFEIAPASAKKAVVGHGGAGKIQVARMAAAQLGLAEPPRPLDASDALALALAHVTHKLFVRSDGQSSR